MRSRKNKVTVVIPVFNDWERLVKAVPFYSQLKEVDILFVDNGSESVPDIDASNISVMLCLKKGSYAARNFALEHADSDIYIFTDSDCVPTQRWLDSLLEGFETSGGLIAGSVEIVAQKPNEPNMVECYDLVFGLPQERYVSKGYAITANLLVPASVFNNVGLFDDSRLSGGDAELCRRAICAGFDLSYCPSAKVFHPARSTLKEIVAKIKRVNSARVSNGSKSIRVLNLIKCVTPPFYALVYAKKSSRPLEVRLRAVLVLFMLWPIGAWIAILSFLTGRVYR